MNIRLVSDFDFELFKKFLPETEHFDKNSEEQIDLLIFPGGEDVSPELYMNPDDLEELGKYCHSNKNRDKYEIDILYDAISGKLKVNKILGICRGIQMINVAFGGSLFPDLDHYGIAHPSVHDICHLAKSNLDFIKTVNSLHHQGIKNMGTFISKLDILTEPYIIATDQHGNVVEIGTWLNGKVLGFQFHPEYYSEYNPDKKKIREFLYDWINGNKIILK